MPSTPTTSSQPASIGPFPQAWLDAFASNWCDDCYHAYEILSPSGLRNMDVSSAKLATYQYGSLLLLPTMNDGHMSQARVLAVVGYLPKKSVLLEMDNVECGTRLFEEDPTHQGPKGALVYCCPHDNSSLLWIK